MSMEMIIYAFIGLGLLYLVIKLLKWPIKILINGHSWHSFIVYNKLYRNIF